VGLVILIALCTPHIFTEMKQIFPAERGVQFTIMLAKNAVQKIVLIHGIREPQVYCTNAVKTCFLPVDVCLEWSLLLQNFSRSVFANLSSNLKDPCNRDTLCVTNGQSVDLS
jgi:hypothetical protein